MRIEGITVKDWREFCAYREALIETNRNGSQYQEAEREIHDFTEKQKALSKTLLGRLGVVTLNPQPLGHLIQMKNLILHAGVPGKTLEDMLDWLSEK